MDPGTLILMAAIDDEPSGRSGNSNDPAVALVYGAVIAVVFIGFFFYLRRTYRK